MRSPEHLADDREAVGTARYRIASCGLRSFPAGACATSDHDSYIVQGWIVTHPDVLAGLDIRDAEAVVEVPARLLGFPALDGLDGDVTNRVPPIAHVLGSGNYIIKGERVSDTEALGQMTIPDCETCVEVPKVAMRALLVGA